VSACVRFRGCSCWLCLLCAVRGRYGVVTTIFMLTPLNEKRVVKLVYRIYNLWNGILENTVCYSR
jgi:hypothetical protein